MKKVIFYIVTTILLFCFTGLCIFWSINKKSSMEPNVYYDVYLSGNLLGVIDSKSELENHINAEQSNIKNMYGIDFVHAPASLDIVKKVSYSENITDINTMYDMIKEKDYFSIDGYEVTITLNDTKEVLYVLNKSILEDSISSIIKMYVGEEEYNNYINKSQSEIRGTGELIDNIYIDNNITTRQMNISVEKKIYTSSEELTQYLVFGENKEEKSYVVKPGDTIEDVAFANEISVQELLLSNPSIKNVNSLLYENQQLAIGITNPKVTVSVEKEVIQEVEDKYKTVEVIDENQYSGYYKVTQEGENGLLKLTQNVKVQNGITVYVQTVSKEELKPSVNKIVTKGGKSAVVVVGSGDWFWPSESGYTITSNYAYRIHPIYGRRELHAALDISGTGYGSDIYAANYGIVYKSEYASSYGNYVVIDHKNGYFTLYAHMSKRLVTVGQAVSKGQLIGLVGSSGSATGPHLHFSAWQGGPPHSATGKVFNPWQLYK